MPNLNLCQFMGHLGQDPRVRKFDDGNKVANFSIAVSERYTDRNGEAKENTTWVDITAFGKLADFVEAYLGKGRAVYVAGKFIPRKYTNADGVNVTVAEIKAERIEALDRKQDQQQGDKWTDRPMRKHGNANAARETMAKLNSEKAADFDPQPGDLPFDRRPGYSR